jgi:hypothetical protein
VVHIMALGMARGRDVFVDRWVTGQREDRLPIGTSMVTVVTRGVPATRSLAMALSAGVRLAAHPKTKINIIVVDQNARFRIVRSLVRGRLIPAVRHRHCKS